MKIAETKIYLKFIAWFLAVAILPLLLLFASLFRFNWDEVAAILSRNGGNMIIFAFFVTLALILILAMIAARLLSRSINNPVQISAGNLLKVVNTVAKSIKGLTDIGKNSRQAVKSLAASTQEQLRNLRSGQKTIVKISLSLAEILQQVNFTAQHTKNLDKLIGLSSDSTQDALSGLLSVKKISTENQKLNQAIIDYAGQVKQITSRVGSVAELAKYLSINASIEANKNEISPEFNALVNQIRELNMISQQASGSINHLAEDMQRQLAQTGRATAYEIKETDRGIGKISQALKILTGLTTQTKKISANIKLIDQQAAPASLAVGQMAETMDSLSRESQNIVKNSSQIEQVSGKQYNITLALNRISNTLQQVAVDLDKIAGKYS